MSSPNSKMRTRLERCADLLEEIEQDRRLLADASVQLRQRLLTASGRISIPSHKDLRKLRKEEAKRRRASKRAALPFEPAGSPRFSTVECACMGNSKPRSNAWTIANEIEFNAVNPCQPHRRTHCRSLLMRADRIRLREDVQWQYTRCPAIS